MKHDWIFDVLEDLRSYAQRNGLSATAAKAEEALRTARAEIEAEGIPRRGGTGLPSKGRPN